MEELRLSDHYSLMFDETTDCSVREQMTLRARYIDSSGDIKVKFLKIIDCLTGRITLDAKTVSDHVIQFIEDHELSYSRLRGIGTDGASTMTGRINGAVKRIQTKQLEAQRDQDEALPCEAVGCHCAAHKLNLASQQAGDGSYLPKFKDIVRQLYDFYDNSAVRSAGLLAVQKLLECPERKVIQPSSTRWLSLGNAVLRLKDILPSVITSLGREAEERGNAAAAGLYQFLSNYQFICTLLLLSDVLPKVNILSKVFQLTSLDFSRAIRLRKSIVSQLEKLKSVDGDNLKALDEFIKNLEESGIEIKYQRGMRQDSSSRMESKARFVKDVKGPFLDKLVANINDRFVDSGVFEAFSIFEPEMLRIGDGLEDDDTNYGDDHVKVLIERFGGYPVEDALVEWAVFKQYFDDHLEMVNGKTATATEILEKLCSDAGLRGVFPIITSLAACYRVLPPHTADCERDFSQMKIIKTYLRNRMSQPTLDGLMRLVIEGPSVGEFPFDRAVKMWANQKNRRLKLD